jgi:hypothetical protein
MIWGENVMVVRADLLPNSSVPVHDHVSEQVTMVERGSVTLLIPGREDIILQPGDVLVIPSSQPHGAHAGPNGASVIELFSPIRQDFIDSSPVYSGKGEVDQKAAAGTAEAEPVKRDPYERLHSFLVVKGIKVPLEELRAMPLELVGRYAYERECLTMGQLRDILGIDKQQAKALLREWKHGDDHSDYSYRRMQDRLVIVPETVLARAQGRNEGPDKT